MSWDFCTNKTPIARRDYSCDAMEWINIALDNDFEFSVEELEIIEKAKAEKFKISKGDQYYLCRGMWDGEFSVFRARIDLNEICLNNNLYSE